MMVVVLMAVVRLGIGAVVVVVVKVEYMEDKKVVDIEVS